MGFTMHATEEQLVELWKRVLRRPSVTRNDNFFEIGGDSLAVTQLLVMVASEFDVSLTLHDILECATLAEQAERIDASRRGEKPLVHVVTMAKCRTPNSPSLFLVPGMFGQLYVLRELANCLGRAFTVYGFKARGVDDVGEPHTEVNEMIADYLAELRVVQPHGPYYLGGYCTGGWVALEMAKRLRDAGETVSLLVQIESFLPAEHYPTMSGAERRQAHLQNLREKGIAYIAEWVSSRVTWEMGKLRKRLFGVDPRVTPGDLRAWPVADAFMAAAKRCQTSFYPGKALLIRAPLDRKYSLAPGRTFNSERACVLPDNGLTPFVGELEVHEVPGDHDSVLEHPTVERIADRIIASIGSGVRASVLESVVK